MKSSILFILFLLLITLTNNQAQTIWNKYAGNPVLERGQPGEWDSHDVINSSIIWDGTTYYMWYGVESAAGIGYATSTDGISWEKYADNPVLARGGAGEWDTSIRPTSVLFDGNEYKLYYAGWVESAGHLIRQTGLATSLDGINWTKDTLNNPVFTKGESGRWDNYTAWGSHVIHENSIYKMWYHGCVSNRIWKIGYAESNDGIAWTKHPDPVMVGENTTRPNIGFPFVIYENNQYSMWYWLTNNSNYMNSQFCYATSPDGLEWNKSESNPILTCGSNTWDGTNIWKPCVLKDGNLYKMWYSGLNNIWSIGYATSEPATIHYVPGDYPIIQDAIDTAVDGDTVIVEEGTYMQQFSFMGKAITVASRYYLDGDTSHISKTIIDGADFGSADSASLVYFINGEDSTSVLSGLTLQNGLGTYGSTPDFDWRVGGAILIENSGATIKNNIIKNNTIISDADFVTGGGIDCFILPEDKNLIIEENIFVNNQVKGDESWGGAFNCEDAAGSLLITKNIVSDNSVDGRLVGSGGGINITTGSSDDILIANNYIRSNKVEGGSDEGGGIAIFNIKVEILNNLLTENSCSGTMNGRGGGISVRYNSTMTSAPIMKAIIINNTLVRNYAEERGSGIFVYNIDADIMNNIIRDNEDTTLTQISFEGAAYTHVIEYSNIEGGLEGTGNIDVDPNFSDTSFCLLMEGVSECIDAGNPAEMYNDVSDPLASNAPLFPACGTLRNDMGAYGGPNSKWELVTDIEDEQYLIPVNAELSQNYPNPFNPSTIIKYDIPIESNVTLKVFDVLGREVTTLVNKRQKAGFYEVEWNAVNNSSGVYFYKILAGDFVETKKMLLLR